MNSDQKQRGIPVNIRHLSEKWVTLYVGEDETLRCTSCSKYLHDQEVSFYLDVNDGLDEVMCRYCWNNDQRETNK